MGKHHSAISRKQSDLEEVIEEVYVIACAQTGCNAEEISTHDAAFDFFHAGWRVVDGEWPACPECVKKIREKLKAQASVASKAKLKNKTLSTNKK